MKWILILALLVPTAVHPQEVPEWFVESFLDIREDAAEAAKDGKRLMLYFMQDGCPYCKQLVTVNFRDPKIVEQTRRNFVPIAINIWGDREVTMADGRKLPEKRFAAALKVQFTPTLVFFDARGEAVHRINGYLPPEAFSVALARAAGKAAPTPSAPAELDVRAMRSAKPMAVLLLAPGCEACDELERLLASPALRAQLERFDVLRASSPVTLVNAKGRHRLSSGYLPAIVFFAGEREVFRTEAYLRRFHLSAALDYVSSGGYAREPSFQRFLQARAERMREHGERVNLWD